ncbi:hypothetical protein MKX01_032918 [Papaver californicum]|nr:hypothetical protein MKX01_032918 [Papaver californicum]
MVTLIRKYSWWSSRNSKWLQENLTDMDAKVTVMIKLIKEDANYFSRRPKMYHKKRPELLKLVEESYRAFRALAERYDYATGALHQAHMTMLDAFPYQIPFNDDSPSSPDGLHKEGSGLSASQTRSAGQKGPGQVKRKYSWWSRKNSKWLQENLADMDAKVTAMIKLIKEEANNFSKRPKMYYKKRPDELLKLVEESYRAYQALGERYDYATVALHQAHKNMSQAFLNQIPFNDDSPSSGSFAAEGFEVPQLIRAFLYPDFLHKEGSGLSSAQSCSAGKKRLRQGNYLFGSGVGAAEQAKFDKRRVTKDQNACDKENDPKVLTKHKVKEHEQSSKTSFSGQNIKARVISEDELVGKVDDVVLKLKQMIAKLQSGIKVSLQHQQSLEKVFNLESRELSEQAIKEENDLGNLTHSFSKAGAGVTNYLQCLESLSDLETKLSHSQEEASVLNERASKAETEAQILKQNLTKLEGENEAAILRYRQCLEKISDFETKLSHAENETRRQNERINILDEKNLSCTVLMKNLQDEVVLCLKEAEEAGVLNERARKAETEVQILKQGLTRLEGENEAANLRYKKCLEKISDLETQLCHAEDETRRHIERTKILDEKNLSCTMSMKNLQDEVLLLKEAEKTGELNARVLLNERASKAETEVQILKQDLIRLEGENEAAILRYKQCLGKISDLESKLSHAEDKTRRHIERTKILDEKILSCTMSMKNLQDEVLCLKEAEENLKEQVELRLEERDAFQQVIYCLKEEMNELNVQYHSVVEQVEHVGFKPDSIGLSVTSLLLENSKMKELYHEGKEENASLLATMEQMEKLLQNNAHLETSLLDVNVELEVLRKKLMALEETSKLLNEEKSNLVAEKAALVAQVEIAAENLATLAEKNAFLEKSLDDVNAELEESTTKSKSLEESFLSLNNERFGLVTERDTLVTKSESMCERLEGLEKCSAELGEKHVYLEKERDALLHEVTEVQGLLDQEKKLHANFAQSNEILIGNLVAEKAALVSEVEIATENLAILEEKSSFLEKSLDEVNAELEKSKTKSKNLEESFHSLKNERLGLVTERDTLVTKLESMRERLEGLQQCSAELGDLEKEKEALLHEVTKVQGLLDQEKQMHASFSQSNEIRIGNLVAEKAALVSLVEIATENLARFAEKNIFLGKSPDDANTELGESKTKSKSLEESFHSPKDERLGLVTERDTLVTMSESLRERMEGLEKCSSELGEKHVYLEKEKEALLHEVTEVHGLLDQEKKMHASFVQSNEILTGNLVSQKAVLVSQVQIATESLARLAEKNAFLEKSLNDANAELEESKTKSKSLEESFLSLKNERLGLVAERDSLVTKLESMHERLEGLQKYSAELGEKHVYLEKEKEALLHEVTEVQGLLDQEKKMHASFAQGNEILIGNLENHICVLQGKQRLMENEFGEEHDKAMKTQLEIFIWQKCIRDIEEKSYALWIECQKHLEASKSSEKLIVDLEQKNLQQQLNVESLSNELANLKIGIHQVLKLLDINYESPDKTEEDERLVQHILKKVEDNVCDLSQLQDDKQQLLFEKSVLVTVFQQMMCDLRNSSLVYRNENSKLLEEIKSLSKDYSNLKEDKCMLEEESIYILEETMVLSNQCAVLKSFGSEKAAELKGLVEGLESLQGINGDLEQEIKMMLEGMKIVEAENLNLKAGVEKLEIELNIIMNQKDLEPRAVEVCNMDLDDERTAKFGKLKGSLCALVGENKEMKSEMTRYAQDMGPLVESINNLEDLMFSHISSASADSQEIKDVAKPRHDKSSQQLSGDHNLRMSDGITDLQDLQRRVKVFEKALIEMKRFMQQESVDANTKTFKAVLVEPKEVEHRDDLKRINTRKPELEISSGAKNVIIVKDIPLDQSSYDYRRHLYATNLRRSSRIDEQQLESWGIVEKDCTNQERNSSTILQEEKEMVVDHPKVSKRVSWEHEEGNTQKVLQRLTSYNLKLSDLKGTMQGLKKKVKKIPKSRTEHSEYDKVERQLQEVGETVIQLLDSNRKLRKNLEETVPVNLDGKAELESNTIGNVSVGAQRMCEKIQCLDLEVQKMQFVLMKLDNEHGTEGTSSDPARISSAPARRKRLALRDYLYSDKDKQ